MNRGYTFDVDINQTYFINNNRIAGSADLTEIITTVYIRSADTLKPTESACRLLALY